MGRRKEKRVELALPVRVWGMDANGQMFEQQATTTDVTTTGARIVGIKHLLHRGCVIGLEHGGSRARFRVTYVGSAENGAGSTIGVQLVESGKFIWGRVIPRVFGDPYEHPPAESNPVSPVKPAKGKKPGKDDL